MISEKRFTFFKCGLHIPHLKKLLHTVIFLTLLCPEKLPVFIYLEALLIFSGRVLRDFFGEIFKKISHLALFAFVIFTKRSYIIDWNFLSFTSFSRKDKYKNEP